MKTFKLNVSSMDSELFSDRAVFLSLRGADGDLAVLPGHSPFITSVAEGECRVIDENQKEFSFECKSGLLSVSEDETVLILRMK